MPGKLRILRNLVQMIESNCFFFSVLFDSPIQYLTSGGGSKAWRGVFTPNSDKLLFFYDGQGFMSLQLTISDAAIMFYDVFGHVLYKWSVTKHLSPSPL